MNHGRSRGLNGAFLRSGVSIFALSFAAWSGAANAQEAEATADQASQAQQSSSTSEAQGAAATQDTADEVVVVGVRRALATAQNIKKNSDTFVDSITATDIGAFPDKSVAEALQRVPGITVSRLQSSDDSSHPSGEGTGVLIRGLTFVRTEFNGRDSFSADAARGLNFNDISPELMAGVDAYKNQTAEMIEGGIAGIVNLRTRLPFDAKGLTVAGTIKATYGSRSKRWSPEFSGLISNVWDTPMGRFGLLGNFARSDVVTRTESVVFDRIDTYCSAGARDSSGNAIIDSDGNIGCTANPFGGTGFAYVPDGIRYSQVDYDRKRRGLAFAGQYENSAGNLLATIQYTNSKYRNAWLERVSHTILEGQYYGTPAFSPRATTNLRAAPGTTLTFGADGMLESGTLTQLGGFWRGTGLAPDGSDATALTTGSAVPGIPFVNSCSGRPGDRPCTALAADGRAVYGMRVENEARNFDHAEQTRDVSANVKWDATDRLTFNFDAQRIKAKTSNDDILVTAGSLADFEYQAGGDGPPEITLLPGSNVNYAEGGLSNAHNYWIPFIQAHLEDNDAKELALRADAEYTIDESGWLNSIKVGVRQADRKQKVRYSTFNWTPISQTWYCNGPGFNADNTTPATYPADCGHRSGQQFLGYGEGIWESVGLGSGFYDGDVYDNGNLVYLNRDTLRDRDRLVQSLSGPTTGSPSPFGPQTWAPICDREGLPDNSCYLPQEVLDVREKTRAAYAMLRFGGDNSMIGQFNVRGNVGVRFVRTEIDSSGQVGFPEATSLTNLLMQRPCNSPLLPGQVVNPACYITPDLIAFANRGNVENDLSASHTNVLPSFNVRFGYENKHFVRFGYSKGMNRPDFGLLRNFVAIQAPVIDATASSPFIIRDSAGNITGYNFVFRAESGSARLKPITANNFDISYEYYPSANTSLTAVLFYKKLNGSISYGEFERQFTNNGSTQNVILRGPRNQSGGGTLKGAELAFQTFFDFLPGALSGLGTQLNYTFVKQSGIENSNLVIAGGLDAGSTAGFGAGLDVSGGRGAVIDSHKLAGISKHTLNAVGLYEKGPLAVRLAYNWRSRFLTNNLDCCIGLPVFQKAAGFLDGSIRYSVNRFVELSVEGTNLLNTTTVYQQQIFGDSAATPDARPVFRDANWNRVDRRFQLGARVKF